MHPPFKKKKKNPTVDRFGAWAQTPNYFQILSNLFHNPLCPRRVGHNVWELWKGTIFFQTALMTPCKHFLILPSLEYKFFWTFRIKFLKGFPELEDSFSSFPVCSYKVGVLQEPMCIFANLRRVGRGSPLEGVSSIGSCKGICLPEHLESSLCPETELSIKHQFWRMEIHLKNFKSKQWKVIFNLKSNCTVLLFLAI